MLKQEKSDYKRKFLETEIIDIEELNNKPFIKLNESKPKQKSVDFCNYF